MTATKNTPLPTQKPKQNKGWPLLALLLVVLLAGGAWLIWQHSKNKTTSSSSNFSAQATIPSGWPEYKATAYGFAFNYDPTWSSPTVRNLTAKNVNNYEVTFVGNSKVDYSVVATLRSGSPTKADIQSALAGSKQGFLKYDGSSYSATLTDPTTKSLAQINLLQIASLPKLNVSVVMVEVLLNPSDKCPAGQLAANGTSGCFTQADYTTVSQFAKSIRPL